MKPFLLLALTGTGIGLSLTTHARDRPNIVLFLVDDMGWMDSETYGSEYYERPNLSRLAAISLDPDIATLTELQRDARAPNAHQSQLKPSRAPVLSTKDSSLNPMD